MNIESPRVLPHLNRAANGWCNREWLAPAWVRRHGSKLSLTIDGDVRMLGQHYVCWGHVHIQHVLCNCMHACTYVCVCVCMCKFVYVCACMYYVSMYLDGMGCGLM